MGYILPFHLNRYPGKRQSMVDWSVYETPNKQIQQMILSCGEVTSSQIKHPVIY